MCFQHRCMRHFFAKRRCECLEHRQGVLRLFLGMLRASLHLALADYGTLAHRKPSPVNRYEGGVGLLADSAVP